MAASAAFQTLIKHSFNDIKIHTMANKTLTPEEKAAKAAAAEKKKAAAEATTEAAALQAAEDTTQEKAEEEPGEESVPEQTDTEADKVAEDAPLSPATSFANTQAELAARRATEKEAHAATRRTRAATADDKLEREGQRILSEYPDAPKVYMTSNGFGFFNEDDALGHATTLRDKTITIVKRK